MAEECRWHINCLEIQAANPSAEIVYQDPEEYCHPNPDRQYDGGGLYKPLGGNGLPPSDRIDKGSLDVVPESQHHTEGATPPRTGEHSSRYGIPGDEGSIRLAAESQNIQENPEWEEVRHRPVCLPVIDPTARVLQLASRPSSSGNRCLATGLVRDDGVCESTMEPHRQSPNKGPTTPLSRGDPSGTSVASPGVVPQTPRTPDRLPITDTTTGGCDDSCGSLGDTRGKNPPLAMWPISGSVMLQKAF